jgi:hypothetical protein
LIGRANQNFWASSNCDDALNFICQANYKAALVMDVVHGQYIPSFPHKIDIPNHRLGEISSFRATEV